MKKILITINDIELKANLLDTPTANAIFDALPIESRTNIWGDEIYFGIPVNMDEDDDAMEEVEIGDLAFWPPGSAFCIFFGRTPVSTNDKPRAASAVNVFGKIEGAVNALRKVKSNDIIKVKRL